MNNLKRTLCLGLALLLLPLGAFAPARAAEQTIVIENSQQLYQLALDCRLDTYSQGKTFVLANDITLEGECTPIPSFGGTFDGQGHSIIGLQLTAEGKAQGLFRYVQQGGTIQNLAVRGTVTAEGKPEAVGGLVGQNEGKILSCSFEGTVEGSDKTGGLCGQNLSGGRIADSESRGIVRGTVMTGGLVGQNDGTVISCQADTNVNAQTVSPALSLDEVSAAADALTNLTAAEENGDRIAGSRTDIGGIAGYSTGLLQGCTSYGTIGYAHIGYNVGGIAGRQTGHIADCVNEGAVYGRKDVGGLVGQAEPDIVLATGEDKLERLRSALNQLDGLVQRALGNANNSNDTISANLRDIGISVDTARNSTESLLKGLNQTLDENIGTVNDLSASVSAALDELSPGIDALKQAADEVTPLLDALQAALDTMGEMSADGGTAMEQTSAAIEQLRAAGQDFQAAVNHFSAAAENLKQAVVVQDKQAVSDALAQMATATADLGDALSRAGKAVQDLQAALEGQTAIPSIKDNQAALDALEALGTALTDMGTAAGALGQALSVVQQNVSLSWDKINAALEQVQRAMGALSSAADKVDLALSSLQKALATGQNLTDKAQILSEQLRDAADIGKNISSALSSAFESLGKAVDRLRAAAPISFTPIADATRQDSDTLFGALSQLSGKMQQLNQNVSSAGKTLTSDLSAISAQFQSIFNLLIDILQDTQSQVESPKLSDLVQDLSETDLTAITRGKLLRCENRGKVQGDRNVGGIAGSVAMEYNLDPEDDASIQISYRNTYQGRAVLQQCINRGDIEGKKDCTGGVVGRLDFGTVYQGQSYGAVESEGGSYVGGLAGYAEGSLRQSYVKAEVTGSQSVGGIAGYAKVLRDCRAIVSVSGGAAKQGAIAGECDVTGGSVTGNLFLQNDLAAIDGVSYAGKAEPFDYERMRGLSDLPQGFTDFSLRLYADDALIETIPLAYGQTLDLNALPAPPEKQGSFGTWSTPRSRTVSGDVVLHAVYQTDLTVLASGYLQDGVSVALAEGIFTDKDTLSATPTEVDNPPAANGNAWHIKLSAGTAQDSVPLRLLANGDKARVWQQQDGGWKEISTKARGKYACLTLAGGEGIFFVQTSKSAALLWWLLLVPVVCAIVFVIIRQKKTKGKQTPTQSPAKN